MIESHVDAGQASFHARLKLVSVLVGDFVTTTIMGQPLVLLYVQESLGLPFSNIYTHIYVYIWCSVDQPPPPPPPMVEGLGFKV